MNAVLKKITNQLKIHNTESTLLYILNNKCSVSRYGDGELQQIISNYSIGFQQHYPALTRKLREVIFNNQEAKNHIICLPYAYNSVKHMTTQAATFWIKLSIKHNFILFRHLPKIQYYDSLCTRPYLDYRDKSKTEYFFSLWKKIWHDQNVYIIEGTHSRLGVGNNLFENVKSLKRILVLAVNAFDRYDEILSSAIKNCAKSDLILLAIGPTATILSFDLAKLGYWAIDIGHIDIEYEWFKNQAT